MASVSGDEDCEKGSMWDLDQKLDQPMEEEAGRLKNMYSEKSLGVVYGDLGTSPLYVFYNTFPNGITDPEDVIGALSLIIYSLTLVPLLKYVFVVLRANDNGQGGTFALYSLLCRHAKISTIPNQHKTDEELTTYSRQIYEANSHAANIKRCLEAHSYKKNAILMLVLIGTCMTIGDGILTPAISVLSASGGIKVNNPEISKRAIGAVNIWKYGSSVLKAFNPVYMVRYFQGGHNNWTSLGGIMLSITGTEALFADLCHFPVFAVQIAFTLVVFPCLLLAYTGQAAYIMQHQDHVFNAFYLSIPVVIVMLVTTLLMIPVMLLVWRSHLILIILFTGLSLLVELTYFSAVLFKINQGGWVPLVFAAAFLLIMYVWHYGTVKRYEFEMHSKVSLAWIVGLGPSLGLVRVPGIGFVYTELQTGVPHIFSHLITNLPAIHSVVVFVCIKYLPVYIVPAEERFLVKRIGPKNFRMFRCVVRYGYKDLHRKDDNFEKRLFDSISTFVQFETMMEGYSDSEEGTFVSQRTDRSIADNNEATISSSRDSIIPVQPTHAFQTATDEQDFLNQCKEAGVVHILGNTIVRARRDSGPLKKLAVNYIYAFLRRICRENSVMFNLPHENLLNVGQISYV
ncbi:putative potassium transporter 11 [Apostasia shenzhenica]|uniref:Putative potassium transporter 11 n=1 Tax=Apostasia shenzhenica TaxID=1088818 RepID=A0A2I0B2R5_9ASPA|nr:putative potassium transporter 11 [Apostasia shenzhenica]